MTMPVAAAFMRMMAMPAMVFVLVAFPFLVFFALVVMPALFDIYGRRLYIYRLWGNIHRARLHYHRGRGRNDGNARERHMDMHVHIGPGLGRENRCQESSACQHGGKPEGFFHYRFLKWMPSI